MRTRLFGFFVGDSEKLAEKAPPSPDLQNDVLTILQTRMDKCTNEQFWMVAAQTALLGFLITQDGFRAKFPTIAVLSVTGLGALYACYYVCHRHYYYYRYRNDMADVLDRYSPRPLPFITRDKSRHWSLHGLSGITFYLLVIVVSWGSFCWFMLQQGTPTPHESRTPGNEIQNLSVCNGGYRP